MPRQLIFHRGHTPSGGGDIAGMLCVFSRFDHTAQQDPAMVTIDRDDIIIGNPVVRECTLDLSDHKSVTRAFRRRIVMMLRADAYTIVVARRRVRKSRRISFGACISNKESAAKQRADREYRQSSIASISHCDQ